MRWFHRGFLAVVLLSGAVWAGSFVSAADPVEDTVVVDDTNDEQDLDNTAAPAKSPAVAKSQTSSAAKSSNSDPYLELAEPRTYRLKWVLKVEAPDGPVKGVTAIGPVPMNWPEQKVRLISQKLSPSVRVSEQVLKGQTTLLKMSAPSIAKGGAVSVERMYEITRWRTKFVMPGDKLKLPRAAPPEMKDQLSGIAPGMEIDHPKVIELTDSLRQSRHDAEPWDLIKGFWSWTRDNVKFENGDFRGAASAIENRCGDCEEMSALFVGMCRLSGIPARTVWVEGHDYPEFYLVDERNKGHWIPAQVLGPAWFGEMAEYRPIFQKGDKFYDPLQEQYVRYAPQTVKVANGEAAPRLIVEHQIIADSDINGPTYGR